MECIICKKALGENDDAEEQICQSCKEFYTWARKGKNWDKKRNGWSFLSWLKRKKEEPK